MGRQIRWHSLCDAIWSIFLSHNFLPTLTHTYIPINIFTHTKRNPEYERWKNWRRKILATNIQLMKGVPIFSPIWPIWPFLKYPRCPKMFSKNRLAGILKFYTDCEIDHNWSRWKSPDFGALKLYLVGKISVSGRIQGKNENEDEKSKDLFYWAQI